MFGTWFQTDYLRHKFSGLWRQKCHKKKGLKIFFMSSASSFKQEKVDWKFLLKPLGEKKSKIVEFAPADDQVVTCLTFRQLLWSRAMGYRCLSLWLNIIQQEIRILPIRNSCNFALIPSAITRLTSASILGLSPHLPSSTLCHLIRGLFEDPSFQALSPYVTLFRSWRRF